MVRFNYNIQWINEISGNSRRTLTIREPDSEDEFPLLRVGGKSVHLIVVELIDTDRAGHRCSCFHNFHLDKLFPQEHLIESSLILTTYSGEQLKVAGQMHMLVDVKYGKQQKQLPIMLLRVMPKPNR